MTVPSRCHTLIFKFFEGCRPMECQTARSIVFSSSAITSVLNQESNDIRRHFAMSALLVRLAAPVHITRQFHTSTSCNEIRKLARLRVVDNSEIGKRAMAEGKPPRCIHIYNKKSVGMIGDKVLVAIKGEMKKAILVGLKQNQNPSVPKFDSNNIVLIEDNGTPLGTRIHVPIPSVLKTILKEKSTAKGADYTKVLAIATKFL